MTSGLRKIVFFILLVGLAYVAHTYMIKPANQNLAQEKAMVEKDIAASLKENASLSEKMEALNNELKTTRESTPGQIKQAKASLLTKINSLEGDLKRARQAGTEKDRLINALQKEKAVAEKRKL